MLTVINLLTLDWSLSMTRLKYIKINNALYTDWFTLGPNFIVRGVINLENYEFSVMEFNSELVLSKKCHNLRNAKDQLKNKLIEIGVKFDGEIRSGE